MTVSDSSFHWDSCDHMDQIRAQLCPHVVKCYICVMCDQEILSISDHNCSCVLSLSKQQLGWFMLTKLKNRQLGVTGDISHLYI